jgi:hypothetical protein
LLRLSEPKAKRELPRLSPRHFDRLGFELHSFLLAGAAVLLPRVGGRPATKIAATTIANVALPYMQGSLSASYDRVSWVRRADEPGCDALDQSRDRSGRAIGDQMLSLQAAIMAFTNDYVLLTAICVLAIPFVIGSTASLRGKKVAVVA